ncbi:NirD/YgiW/YdeI family stress tolerance protein [Marinobacter persicus]|uniref:OB fold (BOF) protein n=1 Tax=Marinobacter persicus TaxID=930118 RepID=A0A2S6G4H2_9GAMM|nr:NirD/YgiW/YdeI family stress tolerance protein [Marinobacter persicus]PPK50904.1 OB fold (BOF) protein [Marinobacter persicus]PPK54018.1 OB fold (BOF) protein [Marinobacter persicus]PPK57193.1 OB fold (BOF) protein [Marinobacter persicus]
MKRTTLSLAIASTLIAAPATALATDHENPYLKSDGSWITLSGKVTSTTADTFTMDYGTGLVDVEMDDWDWFEENGEVLPGDEVTVYGEVDDDTFESAKIEASSVYVDSLGTFFYASPADEEAFTDLDLAPTVDIGELVLTGTVTSVNGSEFTIDTGSQEMSVDTALMPYDPMDDEGFQQINEGDQVTVTGDMEDDTFETTELMADSVVTLLDDSKS